jgi:hypothetical protein
MNFSVPRPDWRASSYSVSVVAISARQVAAGWMFTSMTPGSGVTMSTFRRGSRGGV